jgi:hypothetical protein
MIVLTKKQWIRRMTRLFDMRNRLIVLYSKDRNYKFAFFKRDTERVVKLIRIMETQYTWK